MKILTEKFNENELSELRSKLYNKLLDVMQSPGFGFPKDEAKKYTRVNISIVEDNRIYIEVGAEVSYDGLTEIMEALNPIIQSIDSDSYFDALDSGIICAYLDLNKL